MLKGACSRPLQSEALLASGLHWDRSRRCAAPGSSSPMEKRRSPCRPSRRLRSPTSKPSPLQRCSWSRPELTLGAPAPWLPSGISRQRTPIAGRGVGLVVMVQGLTITRLPEPLLRTAMNCPPPCGDQAIERQPRSVAQLRTAQLRPSALVITRLPVPLLAADASSVLPTGLLPCVPVMPWCCGHSRGSGLAQQAQRLHHLEADAPQPGPGPHRILSAPVGAPVVLSDAALEMGRHTLRNGDIASPCQSQRCPLDHHFSRHGVEERSGTGQAHSLPFPVSLRPGSGNSPSARSPEAAPPPQ